MIDATANRTLTAALSPRYAVTDIPNPILVPPSLSKAHVAQI